MEVKEMPRPGKYKSRPCIVHAISADQQWHGEKITVATIEHDDGSIEGVPAMMVRFTDRNQSSTRGQGDVAAAFLEGRI